MQDQLIAGDSLNFLTATPGYSAADGWVLKFRLIPRSGSNSAIEITTSAEGDDHRTAVAASVTAAWAADNYSWSSWVEMGVEKYTVSGGQIVVRPDPRTVAAGADGRSQARKALDDARAALAAWSPIRRRFKIGERETEFNATADIIALISFWQREVDREESAADPVAARINSGRFYIRATR